MQQVRSGEELDRRLKRDHMSRLGKVGIILRQLLFRVALNRSINNAATIITFHNLDMMSDERKRNAYLLDKQTASFYCDGNS